MDIRPDYGATSTILTEYLREAHIKPSLKLATALYYGIKTDTANFERPAVEADMRAFHYLFEFTRRPLVRRLEFAEFNLPMLRYFQVALNRYCIRHNRDLCLPGGGCRPGYPGHPGGLLRAGRGDLLDHRGGPL